LNFIAKITEGFSGADLTEVCQRAAKFAVRESIVADARIKAMKEANPNYVAPADPVPFITKAHFEESLKSSRRSVNQTDLDRFEQFRKKFDPSFVSTGFTMP
jgi:transitional endoplasmic reticulum ATPase